MKINSKEYNFAEYLYYEYAIHHNGVYYNKDFSFEDAKKYYDWTITKPVYNTAIKWLKGLDLPLYDGYLELNKNYTFWKLETEKSEQEIYIILENKFADFKQKSGVEIFALGRSGRHICIKNTFENAIKYHQLKDLQEKLEDEFVEEANRKYSFEDEVAEEFYENLKNKQQEKLKNNVDYALLDEIEKSEDGFVTDNINDFFNYMFSESEEWTFKELVALLTPAMKEELVFKGNFIGNMGKIDGKYYYHPDIEVLMEKPSVSELINNAKRACEEKNNDVVAKRDVEYGK